MIKDKNITVKITPRNLYLTKKYNCKIGDSINIDISDLNLGSHNKITAICDVCGSENKLMYYKYNENVKRCGYYGCKKCRNIKFKKMFIEKYGVDNPMKVEEIKIKVEENNILKYGFKTTLLEEKTKDKIRKTNEKLYGFSQPLKSEIVKQKRKETLVEKYGVDHWSKTDMFKKQNDKIWFKEVEKRLDIFGFKDYIINSDKTINLKCDCGLEHNFNITYKNIYQRKMVQESIICAVCNPLNLKQSGKELMVLKFIKENYDGEIITNSRNIIKPYELDIYLPELNLAFEFNGLYYHSDIYKDKNYHLNKTNMCEKLGIKLIQIYEDDYIYKNKIVKSRILNLLNKSDRLFARKCEIKEIDDNKLVREFLENNHIQGYINSSVKIGLFYNNELISLITFGKLRKTVGYNSKVGEFELLRFCNKLNTSVVGGANKLFNYFVKKHKPNKVITFADRSWSSGNLYEKMNFTKIKETEPGYHYFNETDLIRKHRFNFRKDKLVKDGYDKNLTEYEIMFNRGYYRIYNSGNIKYEKKF